MLSNDEQVAYLDSIERIRQRAVDHLGSNRGGAVDFIANLHRSVDKIAQQAGAHGQEAECKAGCAGCCSVRVEVSEPEIFLIAREIKTRPAAQIATVIERLRNHVAAADSAPSRRDCTFLEEQLCSIYEVRPAVCRRAHSLSSEKCRSFAPEIPQNLGMLLGVNALMNGTAKAYREVGLGSSPHELNRAVLLALTDEAAEARWYDGESMFPEDIACPPKMSPHGE
ncbi:MAG TPA: YkgJ family cysteine cluster protein [Gallionella sp.]|nr:YkgJ family cysteine cluster protein [Gallionella sp.]